MADRDYQAEARELLALTTCTPEGEIMFPKVAARLQADAELLEQRRIDITAYEQQVEQLEAQLAAARDYLRGFLWLFDEGAFLRDTSRDGEPSYTVRALKLGLWFQNAEGAARRERSGEGT